MSINISSLCLKSFALLIPAVVFISIGLKLSSDLTKVYSVSNDKGKKNTSIVYDVNIQKLYTKITYGLFVLSIILIIAYAWIIVYSTIK